MAHDDQDEARAFLTRLRDELQEHARQSRSVVARDVFEKAAATLSRFLDGVQPTLDAAFGLTSPLGRPPDHDRRLNLAREVTLRQDRDEKTLETIAEEFENEGCAITSVRALGKLLLDFEVALQSEKLSRNLKSETQKPEVKDDKSSDI